MLVENVAQSQRCPGRVAQTQIGGGRTELQRTDFGLQQPSPLKDEGEGRDRQRRSDRGHRHQRRARRTRAGERIPWARNENESGRDGQREVAQDRRTAGRRGAKLPEAVAIGGATLAQRIRDAEREDDEQGNTKAGAGARGRLREQRGGRDEFDGREHPGAGAQPPARDPEIPQCSARTPLIHELSHAGDDEHQRQADSRDDEQKIHAADDTRRPVTNRTIQRMATSSRTATQLRITSYGVRIDIAVQDPNLVPQVMDLLPPGWQHAADEDFPDAKFALHAEGDDWRYIVSDSSKPVSRAVDLDVALAFLEWRLRGCVAAWAPGRIFVHAGVVVRGGRALLIPGLSFSGKSMLVAALIGAGATYFSDEFAVLDTDGFVHPYPKPLSLRRPDGAPTEEVDATALGSTIGEGRAPVALVAVTTYVPDARWDPAPMSPGAAALALLSHAVPAQERPVETLAVVRRVAQQATCIRSERGAAESVVPALLELLDAG